MLMQETNLRNDLTHNDLTFNEKVMNYLGFEVTSKLCCVCVVRGSVYDGALALKSATRKGPQRHMSTHCK